MISKIENGSALAITIMDGEENVFLKLGLFKEKSWGDNTELLAFYYFNGDDPEVYKMAHGTYSGGPTGGGINPRYPFHVSKETGYLMVKRDGKWEPEEKEISTYTHYRILVTDNVREMNPIIDAANDVAEKEREAEDKRKSAIAEKINLLPKLVPSKIVPFLAAERSEASYRPSYSSKIQGGQYYSFIYSNGGNGHFDPANFITQDGKCQAYRFKDQYSCYNEWKPILEANSPKTILLALKKELDDLNKEVKAIE